MKKNVFILFSIIILFLQNSILANEDKKNTSITYLPIVYYTPETKLAGGALVNYNYFHTNDTIFAFPSTIMPHFVYTLNNQLITQLYTDWYFNRDKYILQDKYPMWIFLIYFMELVNIPNLLKRKNLLKNHLFWRVCFRKNSTIRLI